MSKMSPFDVFKNVSNDTKELEDLSGHVPFIVNRLFGGFPDTLFYAQELNVRGGIPKDLQYHFLFNLVPKRKRYGKWTKKDEADKAVEDLMEMFPELSPKELRMAVDAMGLDRVKEVFKAKGGR